MPRASMLTADEQAVISALNDAGESHKNIAEKLNRSRHVVASYLRDPQAYGKKKSCGRPRKNSVQFNHDTPPDPCRCSASRLPFHRMESDPAKRSHPSCRTAKAPWITEEHKRARLIFAQENMEIDWSRIVWSDEKKFNLDGCDGQKGGSLMVWGAFCEDGKLELAFPSMRMDSTEYQEVLLDHLLSSRKDGCKCTDSSKITPGSM
ncbi:hypothetical protein ANCDUO_03256 [Ancylostoma duodenale]|uniref:Tc3 transposase DNA binding domain-containing protein n=1 Tax=Ancylostoma duodenale TaxID=51022 RepID=A0A0C2HAC2_9BILA|nr:hypothetical protein ANCDUO_03256 [Ancylostoma duodenale]